MLSSGLSLWDFYQTLVNLGSRLMSLTSCCFDLTDVTLAGEDTNSKATDEVNRANFQLELFANASQKERQPKPKTNGMSPLCPWQCFNGS